MHDGTARHVESPRVQGLKLRVKRGIKRLLARLFVSGRSPADPRRGVSILAYHYTTDDSEHHWWVDFAGHMALIEDLGYEVVSLAKAVRLVTGEGAIEKPTLALTFDDGWRNNADVAFPRLAENGWPATVFVATRYLGRRQYLTVEQLSELPAMGVAVGNHTHGHVDVTTIHPPALLDEIEECSRRIEDICDERPRHFCYPFGRYSREARALVEGAGFESACSGRVGSNRPRRCDPFRLKRLTIDPRDGVAELRLRLAGGYDYLDWRQRRMDA